VYDVGKNARNRVEEANLCELCDGNTDHFDDVSVPQVGEPRAGVGQLKSKFMIHNLPKSNIFKSRCFPVTASYLM
jgi:hypothetical protein